MLPHSDHLPAPGHEAGSRIGVTLPVPLDLLAPPAGVGFRPGGVLWATVPEAPVYEDGDLGAGEHDVRPAPWENRVVDAVPEPATMELATQGEFRGGVAHLLSLHRSALGLARFLHCRHCRTVDQDHELDTIMFWLSCQEDVGGKITSAVRGAIDDVLNTRHLNRVDIHGPDVGKTEKTHVGTRVEIRLIKELDVERGAHLDMLIEGIEVDVKFTLGSNWMIPSEAIDKLCLLINANDRKSVLSAGVLRCQREWLTGPAEDADVKQRDGKRSVSKEGKTHISYVLPPGSPLTENMLLHLEPDLREFVLGEEGQQTRFIELFRRKPNHVLTRHYVEAIGRSTDPQRRVRNVGPSLAELGLTLLCGTWIDQRDRAAQVGIEIGDGDFVAIPTADLEAIEGDPALS